MRKDERQVRPRAGRAATALARTLCGRLGLRDRVQLVVWAYRNGLDGAA